MNAPEVYQKIIEVQKKHKAVGSFFSVINTKKDGTERVWNCRFDVTKHLRGGELPYDNEARDLLTVFCTKSKMYRQLNVQTIKYLKVCGETLVENYVWNC